MTPLHRAARIANTDLAPELFELKADVNAATYPSRPPGSTTPLQCLAEADMSRMDMDGVRRCTSLLFQAMNQDSVCQKTTRGRISSIWRWPAATQTS